MSSEGLDFEDVPEEHRWDMFGVVLGILQDAGYDLDRFTDGELRRAAALAYDASVVSTHAWLGQTRLQAATEARGELK
jgi:hypothetical protein